MKTITIILAVLLITACTPVEYPEHNALLCDPNTGKAYIYSAQQRYGTTRMPSADSACNKYKVKE